MMRSRTTFVRLSLCLSVVLLNCDDHPAEPEPRGSNTRPAREASGHPIPEGIDTLWNSGSVIRLQVDTAGGVPSQTVLNAIKAAAREWNEYVFDLPGLYDELPHLVDDTV